MKITKVTYQKTYSIGPYLTDRVGIEADPEGDETPADVLDNLRAKADEWHKAEHPHLYQDSKPDNVSVAFFDANGRMTGVVPIINKDFERMEIEIDNCSTIDALVKWKKDHDVLPGKIIVHYNRRLSELGVAE